MENYNNEKEYFIEEVFKKAYFGYWDTEAEYSKANDEFFDLMVNGQVIRKSTVEDTIKGLEKLREIKERLDKRKEELRETEKKLRLFNNP